MKRVLFAVLSLCLFASFSFAQLAVRTETASNKYKYRVTATTGDTIYTHASLGDSSSGVHGVFGYVVGVLFGSPVASDTVIIKNGLGTVATIIQPETGMVPLFYPIGAKLDTSLIFIQKKASATTLIYRIGY